MCMQFTLDKIPMFTMAYFFLLFHVEKLQIQLVLVLAVSACIYIYIYMPWVVLAYFNWKHIYITEKPFTSK